MDASSQFEAVHNPLLWATLTPTQKGVADLMMETDPTTGRKLTVVEVARRLDTSRKNVYKILRQIGTKATKLAT